MFTMILLTILGWLLEAGAAYCLYRIIARQIPALLYRILLTWVFWQVLNTLAALTTWFIFQANFSLLLFYVLFIVFCVPFVLWAFLGKRREGAAVSAKEPPTANEKTFLLSFGILFLILFLSTARHGFMPQWGNVDMANQFNAINSFHANMLPDWTYAYPYVIQAGSVLQTAPGMWGYIFGYNFLTALLSRLTFVETIYMLNITTCFNMALWLSAPLLLVEWKKARVWTVLYWVWLLLSVNNWYSAVDRGWLTSIYSLGQCLIVLTCIFYTNRHSGKNRALFYVSMGIGSFMVANAHPYNYPIFFLSVLLMALFSGEQRLGRRIRRALGYGAISMLALAPLMMQSAFKKVFQSIFGYITSGDFAGLLTIRNFEMLTSAKAPMWLGIIGMLIGIAVVLFLVRSVKRSYIVGISAVATVVGLYAVYGSNGYLYQKAAFLAPPLFFLLALHLIHDVWQLVYDKWIAGRTKIPSGKWQAYVLAPVLISALLLTGQADLDRGITRIQDRLIDVKPMIEPEYYRASKVVANNLKNQGGRGLVNFRSLDGARKMFLSRIVRADDMAQSIPDLDYFAVESTSYDKLIQYVDMASEDQRLDWETGVYLVHDTQDINWPAFDTLSMLLAEEAQVFSSGDIAVTRLRLSEDVRSSYIPLAGGVIPVRVERVNTRTFFNEDDLVQETMARIPGEPGLLSMDNPLTGISGDMLFLIDGTVNDPGRVTLRIQDAYGREIAHRILSVFDGLMSVVIPREELGQGAARIELDMEPGDAPDSVALRWMRVYAVPGGE